MGTVTCQRMLENSGDTAGAVCAEQKTHATQTPQGGDDSFSAEFITESPGDGWYWFEGESTTKLQHTRLQMVDTSTDEPDRRKDASAGSRPVSLLWCPEGDLNPHDRLRSADFKSAVSADFTIRALAASLRRHCLS